MINMISLIINILKELCRRGEVGDHLSILDELILRESKLLRCLIEILQKNQQFRLEAVEQHAQLQVHLFIWDQQNLICHVNNKSFLWNKGLFSDFLGSLSIPGVWLRVIRRNWYFFLLCLLFVRCVESDFIRGIQNIPF